MFGERLQCVRCYKYFFEHENIGQWKCRVHPKNPKFDRTDGYAETFPCCGLSVTEWTRIKIRDVGYIPVLYQRYRRGCIPCDHLSILDAEANIPLSQYAFVPNYLPWDLPLAAQRMVIPDINYFESPRAQKTLESMLKGNTEVETLDDLFKMLRVNAFNSPLFFSDADSRGLFLKHYEDYYGGALVDQFNILSGDLGSASSYWQAQVYDPEDMVFEGNVKAVKNLQEMVDFLGTSHGVTYLKANQFGDIIEEIVGEDDNPIFIPFRVVDRYALEQDPELLWRAEVIKKVYQRAQFYS